MNTTKKILVISFSNLKNDVRVRRQLFTLKEKYDVTAVGTADPEIMNIRFIDVSFRLNKLKYLFQLALPFLGFHDLFYGMGESVRKTSDALKDEQFDLVLANDSDSLPLALELAKKNGAKVIFDAHEYTPHEHNDDWKWRLLFKRYKTHIIRKYAGKADLMFTVCQPIVDKYEQEFGLQSLVMTNATDYTEIDPVINTGNKIRLIHHGMAHRVRKIENMIAMMDFVDERFELDLMLVYSKKSYYDKMVRLAEGKKNIRFLPAVPATKLVELTAGYDMGIFLLEPTNFNTANALPNKLFEFIQSRLGIAVGPTPEMARIVRENDLGVVSDDFTPESMATALNKLTSQDIVRFKEHSHKLAKVLNASQNMELLNREVDRLLS